MSTKHRQAWDAALWIIDRLRAEGHTALLAGGCVRDRLLGRTPKDYDVVTDAVPDRVRKIFPRAREVGVKFGVMLVRRFGHDIEVATFRSEGTYSDGRRPDSVTFGSEKEDAHRRDFTINGLFFDPIDEHLIDHVNGRQDLEARLVRTIGDPDQRFAEDHLRMLRAVRIAARLDFTIHAETAAAINRSAARLRAISPERVWMELEMLLTDPSRAVGWSSLVRLGLRPHLADAWTANDSDDELVRRRLSALPALPVRAPLAMGCALAGYSEKSVTAVGRELRLSNRELGQVRWLVRSLARVQDPAKMELADLKTLMVHVAWADLLELLRADLVARQAPLDPYQTLRARAEAIPPASVCPAPLLTGDDLCALGMRPGPRLGQALRAIRRAQLNEMIHSREEAVVIAETWLEE